MDLQASYETWKGEGLKNVAEATLHRMGEQDLGRKVLEAYAFNGGERIHYSFLYTQVAGIYFENPVLFGAGWDKKGRAVHGLYALGFGGGEVGTVLPYQQTGNPKPRLWTITSDHSVGLNRLGFNALGMGPVEEYLEAAQPLPCPIGINVGRNKEMPNDMAVWAHNQVIARLGKYASYITLGISSPNTPGLRGLQDKGPFRDLVQGARAATELPIFAKIDAERTVYELDDMIEVALEEGLAGFVATNTYMGQDLKAKYGPRWAGEAGGLSGADADYRKKATETVRYIYEQAGDRLDIIGAGGVSDTEAALEKLKAGASAVQVVTAIRPSKGKIAAHINRTLITRMELDGVSNVRQYIGIGTKRGLKVA